MIELRPYQAADVEKVRDAFRAGKRAVLLQEPTGAGKTVMFTFIAQAALARGSRILLIAHRRELITQISQALTGFVVEHGITAPGHPRRDLPVQVASKDSLIRRLEGEYDLIIIDEAHHTSRGSGWGKILDHYGCRVLGVTATPCRLDGKGLGVSAGGYFDHIICGPSVRELIDLGHLSDFRVFAPPPGKQVDLSGVKTLAGDYKIEDLEAVVDRPVLTGDVVDHYRRLAGGMPAIAFAVTVTHAHHIAEEFAAAGFQAAALSGKTGDDARERMIRDLGTGALHVLASCNVISEGTDIPRVGCAILMRPTKSLALHFQQVGRGLRQFPGKEFTVILDHAGNCHRHGLPTDPQEWTLEGNVKQRQKRETGPAVKQCPACYAVVTASTKVCYCGHEFRVEVKALEVAEGELVELRPGSAGFPPAEKKRALAAAMQGIWRLSDLQAIAKEFGYAPGWAWHQAQRIRGRRSPSVEGCHLQ